MADSARLPEIWFFMRGDRGQASGVDTREGWDRLFLRPDVQWPRSLDHVSVIGLSNDIPDDILKKAIDVLNRRHIKLALEVLAQSWVGQPVCGHNVDGYTDPPGNAQIARRIKAAGGTIDYITMDGPLYSGHYQDGPTVCHSSIDNVAERAAAIIDEYRAVFPQIEVGDIEPFPDMTKQPGWRQDYRRWLDAFRQATGIPISFLVMDINWPEDGGRWTSAVTDAVGFAQTVQLPIAIIYNASLVKGPKSDEAWLESASQNFTQIERGLKFKPAKVLFESWDKFPKRSITDDSGPGEDTLVSQYVRFHGIGAQ